MIYNQGIVWSLVVIYLKSTWNVIYNNFAFIVCHILESNRNYLEQDLSLPSVVDWIVKHGCSVENWSQTVGCLTLFNEILQRLTFVHCYALGRLWFLLFIINVDLVPCVVCCALLPIFLRLITPSCCSLWGCLGERVEQYKCSLQTLLRRITSPQLSTETSCVCSCW